MYILRCYVSIFIEFIAYFIERALNMLFRDSVQRRSSVYYRFRSVFSTSNLFTILGCNPKQEIKIGLLC